MVMTAVIFSALGVAGFTLLRSSARGAVETRVNNVMSLVASELATGRAITSLSTPDGVTVWVVGPHQPARAANKDDVVVLRRVKVAKSSLVLEGRAPGTSWTNDLEALHAALWFAVALVVVLSGFVGGYAVHRSLRAVRAVAAQARQMGSRELDQRLPDPDTGDELADVVSTLNEMLARLESARNAQLRFTSDAAHELRSPLMVLRGEIDLLERNGGQVEAHDVDRMSRAVTRLGELTSDLALLATVDERPAQTEHVDLADLVIQAVDVRGTQVRTRAVTSVVVLGEPAQLVRLVSNLLDNALVHGGSMAEISVERDGNDARLVVDDDGPGVPESQRTVLFERFFRSDSARPQGSNGTGLGLAIVAEVAAAHGGTVLCSDSPLGGARFVVSLPVAPN